MTAPAGATRPARARREAIVFWAVVAAFAAFLVWMAAWTPRLLDDWIPFAWHRWHDLELGALGPYTLDNYVSHNPRLGDTWLLLVNGPRGFHLVLTPLFELALPPLVFAIALARRPRATLADLRLLALIQALLWLMLARPGVIYFYRPHTTNYLFPVVLTLLLFLPYRLELARATAGPARHWLAPLWLVLGLAVGLGNEHTGIAIMLAGVACLVVAIRRRRLRPWMMAGVVGVFVTYPLLVIAPGQSVRYGGMATRTSPLETLVATGVDGNLELVTAWLADAGLGLAALALAVLVYLARGAPAGRPARGAVLAILACVVLAGVIAGVIGVSPSITDRLYMAPTVLLVAAAIVVVDHAAVDRVVRGLVTAIVVVALGVHVVRFVQVMGVTHGEASARHAQLAAAAPGSVVAVRPFTYHRYSRWSFGDDLRLAPMRAYVATEVYDLGGIDYVPLPRWGEPQVPEQFAVELAYDPPVATATLPAAVTRPLTFWRWTINYSPRTMDRFKQVPGHTLVAARAYWPDARAQFPAVGDRTVDVMRWRRDPARRRGDFELLDGREAVLGDVRYLVIDRMPPGWTEIYVGGCGVVRRVEATTIDGLVHIPVDVPACTGMVNAVVCWPDRCWFGGRSWNGRPGPWIQGTNRVQKA